MKKPTFPLPIDDYIDVRSVPELFAAAKYPDLNQPQQITGLGKRLGRATLELDEADKAILCNAWQPLAWPMFPMDCTKWQPYADALAASSSPPPWQLVTYIDDVRFGESMLRLVACEEYRKDMEVAMLDGEIEWRSELTLLPVPAGSFQITAAFNNGGFVMSRDELKRFAERAGFKVETPTDEPQRAIPYTAASFAKDGNDARHARHREYKQKVIDLYKNGDYASKNAAADDAFKQFPIERSTARNWLKGIKKST